MLQKNYLKQKSKRTIFCKNVHKYIFKLFKRLKSRSLLKKTLFHYIGQMLTFSIIGLLRIMECFGLLSKIFIPGGSKFEDKCVLFVSEQYAMHSSNTFHRLRRHQYNVHLYWSNVVNVLGRSVFPNIFLLKCSF